MSKASIIASLICLTSCKDALGFVPFHSHSTRPFGVLKSSPSTHGPSGINSPPVEEEETVPESSAVRAPLKYIGPYPCLALKFPNLATSSQRSRNVTGISLDFVLDTAANTNTINAQVAQELDLDVVGASLPGYGAAGMIDGANTYLLGDCQLEGLEEEDAFTFMTGLTASSLAVPSPAAAGLLSTSFFNCFDAVEFQWGTTPNSAASLVDNKETVTGDDTPPAAITFYGQDSVDRAVEGLTRVPIQRLPVTQLPSITVRVNGFEMPALLDTGSPITVMNAEAARRAGIDTTAIHKSPATESRLNPFSAIANRFKQAQETAQAAARGDVVMIAGANGQPVELLKSNKKVDMNAVNEDSGDIHFGQGHIYVGDLPGLSALNGLGKNASPAIVLGMDVLRCRPKMTLRLQEDEVYF